MSAHTKAEVEAVLDSSLFSGDFRLLPRDVWQMKLRLRSFLANAPTGAKLVLKYRGKRGEPVDLPELGGVVGADGRMLSSFEAKRIVESMCVFDTIVIDSSRDSK